MLKRKLVKQCEDLFEKLNSANATISKQKDIIDSLRKEIFVLNEEIERLSAESQIQPEEAVEVDEVIDEANTKINEVKMVIPEEKSDELNITDYASSVIGKIVIEATKKSNQISSVGATAENKELINLILGRTEVAKSEILNIVLSNLEDSDKRVSIDKVYLDSCEYFKGILLQY